MNDQNSKKQILKSSSIIGGASVITIIIGLIKVKALAVLLGPTGVGLMGMLLSLLGLASTVFSLGLGTIGVREVAINRDNPEKINQVRKALFLANIILGLFAVIVITLNRKFLSNWLFDNTEQQWAVCFIGIAVFVSLIGGAQGAVLQGFRKINEQAKIKIIGAILSTIIGLGLIGWLGEEGITGFVISVPIIGCLLGFYYTRQLPNIRSVKLSWSQLWPLWKSMVTLGFVYMLSGVMGESTKLLTREILNQELGLISVGYFQAAWSISMTYIGFVLGAMATDYYPRLTETINNKKKANELINQQTEIALTFSAPILFAMLSFSPIVIHLLYSKDFTPAIEILRWQIMGDILKIIAWPLGFIVLSLGKGKVFFLLEMIWNMFYLVFVYFGIHQFDIQITGYAFAFSYFIYLMVTYLTVLKLFNFKWDDRSKYLISIIIINACILLFLSYFNIWLCMIIGLISITYSLYNIVSTLDNMGVKNKAFERISILVKEYRFFR
ncbi:O-antigen translocase [Photobacterium leiognathi]|uniref:O-antigen translocase n=1 Tax=Photobacterium leiognathi TaxID=553611 RepID=UPI001EDCD05D|nr:O-antigen translocase [Photobacterium leiognathi]MCG3886787.1 O-antigen translocase [Photobacterium leiognathi]